MSFSQRYKWEFKLGGEDTLAYGDQVTLFARYSFPKMFRINRYWWEDSSSKPADSTTYMRALFPDQVQYLYAMPNLVNIFQSFASPYSGAKNGTSNYGLTSGLVPGPYSVAVSYKTYKNVWMNLTDLHGNVHMGRPRCLDMGISRRVLSKYPPTYGNNILFAEELALKANILASDNAVTPAGLGSLMFHGDSTNPFNGLSVRKIAAKLDTAMSGVSTSTSYWRCTCDSNFFDIAYRTIRMIDSAFSGPVDTIGGYAYPGEYASIVLKPVRMLSAVPFLSVDSNFAAIVAGNVKTRDRFATMPMEYKLEQNYPNPFNPTSTIQYGLPTASRVSLKVYNVLGQIVATLTNGVEEAGYKSVQWNASNFASGVYFYRIEATNISDPSKTFIQVRKMVLVK